MASPPLDLLVVGAGPVGLATAAAALQSGCRRVLVVDQARDLRPVGSNIDLLPNAYRVLCTLVPAVEERLRPFLRTETPGKSRFSTVTPDGRTLTRAETHNYGTTASLYWWQLQKVLLDSLPDKDIVVLNHQLINIAHDDTEGVAIAEFAVDRQRENRFKNWEGDDTDNSQLDDHVASHSFSHLFQDSTHSLPGDLSSYGPDVKRVTCRAKIIVGADGINSVARRCIYRDTSEGWERFADATYSGFSKVVAAGDPTRQHEEEQTIQSLYMKNSVIAMLTCDEDRVAFDSTRVMLVHPQKTSKAPFRWYLGFSLAMEESSFANASKSELRQFVLDRIRNAGFSEALANLSSSIWDSSDKDHIPSRAYYIVPATHPPPYEPIATGQHVSYPPGFYRPWHYGRVVLAGDSAHACPPFLAQGTAMGFEDVFELMKRLSEIDAWSQHSRESGKESLGPAFEKYRRSRLDRVCFAQNRVMNRVSEYDTEKGLETRTKLWTYDPAASSPVDHKP